MQNVPRVTLFIGTLLILTGVIAYFATDQITAFIPAPFGLILALMGYFAFIKPHLRKHLMHAAAGWALLGFLATVTGLIGLVQMIFGAEVERPLAVIVQSIMAGLTLLYLVIAVKSFINARRAQKELA